MRHPRRAAVLTAAALLALPAAATAASSSGASVLPAASVQPWLADQLGTVTGPLKVAVRATSTDAAASAAQAAGLVVQQRWELASTVIAIGTAPQVRAVTAAPGVLRVDGNSPLTLHSDSSHRATRSDVALETLRDASGNRYDGTGVSIAVIDSGIDGTHPMFAGGKVVQNRKNACGIELSPTLSELCFAPLPDTDTPSGGGHGTHVAGIAAGNEVTTTTPSARELRGAAPGAKLVGLSVGAAIGLLDAAAAQYWVLEHHQNPCRSAAEQTESEVDAACPPIRVTNHSYGPAASDGSDNTFDESAISVQLQRQLAQEGVVAVWAAGNDGGDGTNAFTNPDAMDPTPGIVMVASYDDDETGERDRQLSTFSSRGKQGTVGSYPDVAAPGDTITNACRAYLPVCSTGLEPYDLGDYNTISGTSMAAPYIAGVVAQLFQADPALTPAEVEDVLEDTAYKFTAGGPYEADTRNADDTTSFDKGHGLVDVVEALNAVTAAPAPSPSPSPTATATPTPTPTKKGNGKPSKP